MTTAIRDVEGKALPRAGRWEIDAASIDTREPQRDEHLRSPDFLDAERYPKLRFEGAAADPTQGGAEKAVLRASTRINREAFGLTWNMALETGGWLVGKDIDVEIEVEAVRAE